MSLDNFLENLADPALSLSNSDFIELSDLSPAELGVFARHWFRLSPERKRAVLTTMVELAEDSLELDFSTIFKLCLKDDDDWVLEKAIDGLWEYEDRSVLPGLLQVLASYRGPDVRAAAASALGKFCVLAQEGYLLSPDAANIHATLMAHLQDPDESLEVRRRSLEAVAPFNTPDIRDLVCWAYRSDDLLLKSSAVFAMGRTGDVSWLPILVQELDNGEPALRYETANACGDLGEEDLFPTSSACSTMTTTRFRLPASTPWAKSAATWPSAPSSSASKTATPPSKKPPAPPSKTSSSSKTPWPSPPKSSATRFRSS